MTKKLTLLAAAIAALVAFAVPASASAEVNWFHNGGGPTVGKHIHLEGKAGFTGLNGNGAHATVTATIVLGETGTGTVTEFKVSGCTGTGPNLNNLPCTATVKALPWTVHATANGTILITDIEITNDYYLSAAHSPKVAETTLHGDIIATPDSTAGINSVELEGSGTTAGGNPAQVTGELAVTPASESGTYGFE